MSIPKQNDTVPLNGSLTLFGWSNGNYNQSDDQRMIFGSVKVETVPQSLCLTIRQFEEDGRSEFQDFGGFNGALRSSHEIHERVVLNPKKDLNWYSQQNSFKAHSGIAHDLLSLRITKNYQILPVELYRDP
ncbi:hypothetical protein QAD02_010112 [Eretmocerus hayati]|uniref:Uncharacterized protein n=1 Tax=Eretmocerus hayati TaxID=131215 RepID=A0ACC2NDM7_9HYME|nr:hypothetical protein QAD02_010112 [Eretmocerus hayati]